MLLLAFEVCFSILTLRFSFCGGGGVCFCVCVCVCVCGIRIKYQKSATSLNLEKGLVKLRAERETERLIIWKLGLRFLFQ